jgi:amino acid exporter
MSPGPNTLSVIGTSMATGRKAGAWLFRGDPDLGTAAIVGLAALIAQYAVALIAIKMAGGAHLLWLASKAFRAAASAGRLAPTSLPLS